MNRKKKNSIPEYINSPLNNPMINYSVYKMKKAERLLVVLISFIIGGLVGQIFYGGLFKIDDIATTKTYISNIVVFIIVGICAVKFLVPLYKKNRLEKRRSALNNQFRDMLESIASSFAAGGNVMNAFDIALADLRMQYNETDYIVAELKEIVDGIRQNIRPEEMLAAFAQRTGNEDIESFADIFNICYQKGGNMSDVVQRTHSVMTQKMAVADEIKTKLTSNKMQHNIMSLMPIALVFFLKLSNDSFAESFATATGVIANTVAIGIFVGSYLYGQKIVDIKV